MSKGSGGTRGAYPSEKGLSAAQIAKYQSPEELRMTDEEYEATMLSRGRKEAKEIGELQYKERSDGSYILKHNAGTVIVTNRKAANGRDCYSFKTKYTGNGDSYEEDGRVFPSFSRAMSEGKAALQTYALAAWQIVKRNGKLFE